jgi:hypothetical protein
MKENTLSFEHWLEGMYMMSSSWLFALQRQNGLHVVNVRTLVSNPFCWGPNSPHRGISTSLQPKDVLRAHSTVPPLPHCYHNGGASVIFTSRRKQVSTALIQHMKRTNAPCFPDNRSQACFHCNTRYECIWAPCAAQNSKMSTWPLVFWFHHFLRSSVSIVLSHTSKWSFKVLKPTFSATNSFPRLFSSKDRSPGSKHCRTQRTRTSSETTRPCWAMVSCRWLSQLPSALVVSMRAKSS